MMEVGTNLLQVGEVLEADSATLERNELADKFRCSKIERLTALARPPKR
jgi:hypothetical protein